MKPTEPSAGAMKALQLITTEQDKATAETVLDFCLDQENSIGGRILPPCPQYPHYRIQAFYRDEPDLSDDCITEMGMRRVIVLDSQIKTLGIKLTKAQENALAVGPQKSRW